MLAVQRVVQIAADLLYVALIPRAMGAEGFGQFSTVQSISMWFTMMSGLGAVSLMTRYVPEFLQGGDIAGLRKLTGSLFTLRLGTGALGAILYFAFVRLWLRELDGMAIAILAFTITVRIASSLPFTLLLGLNQAARWGAGELVRRLLMLPLTYAGFAWAGLRGACAALALTETVVLCLGLWWTHAYVARPSLPIDREFLKPFLKFSAVFFVGNILIVFFNQGGAPLVRLLSGEYAEAGYYAVAFGSYQAGAFVLWNLVNGFGALFTSFKIKGNAEAVRVWTSRLLRMLAVCGVLASGLLYSCADLLVTHVLGKTYAPVAVLLPVLALAGLASGPGSVARILLVSYDQGVMSIHGAAVQLVCFVALSALLIPRFGSLGACVGIAVATMVFSLYSTWRIQEAVQYPLGPWAGAVLLGVVCSPLLWAWSGFGPVRFGLFAVVYVGAATVLGVARLSEGRALLRAVRSGA
ncbi:MAG: oligosaccharide flippase family protein [Acidobacteriota bacterium]